ncbi:AsmA-like C-terminal region-containing protein [Dongia soli]|uniref:AsmA-like C-terminal region-containing protein n=1 Tax=Dongia soli TaxID=600628 RepID=A0ABU5E8K7_9PROT|nr:AsmA-like C-terminal region-containing protein [Dongia soli]MDY0882548.1 AsmA-like C-terminal region-containing protein [Dongia soli]
MLAKDEGDDAEQKSSEKGWTKLSLQTPDENAPRIAARIAAKQMVYGNIRLGDLYLDGKVGPGDVTLSETRFNLASSRFYVAGVLKPEGDGSRLTASLALEDGKIERFINLLFGESADVQGRVDGKAVINLRGATLGEGLKTSDGALVLSVTDGRIARALLEKIATDLRALFRRGTGTAKISCMLGVMQLKNGMGTIESFKLRTPEANLNGEGRIDLLNQNVDLFLQSEADSTGFFALDVPLQIAGNWRNPKIRPASKSVSKQAGAEQAGKLPASLRQLADGNRCSQQ